MSTPQIVLYALLAIIVLLYIRRKLMLRGMKQYSPTEVADLMKQSGAAILLDVRTAAERQRKMIKGSMHIPLHELGRRTDELEKYKNKEVICYCQSGNRSLTAASRLKKAGFTVANLKGGIVEWNSSGLQ
jgi:rhodanese-related sulfurtransferase